MTSLIGSALAALAIAVPGFTADDEQQPIPPPVQAPVQLPVVGALPGQVVGNVLNGVAGAAGPMVDLSRWKLTLPVAADKGNASQVEPMITPAEPWLFTRPDTGVTFWAPVSGVTTPNSTHPRSELVSQTTWPAGTSAHTLNAQLAVWQVPSKSKDVIIGQIHGALDIKSVSFVMLHYSDGVIRVVVKKGQSGPTSDKYELISGVPLGGWFTYSISDNANGSVSVTATYGPNTRTATVPVPSAFTGATVRFQAGAYQQDEAGAGTGPTDGGWVSFYHLMENP